MLSLGPPQIENKSLASCPRSWYIGGVYQANARSRLRPEALLPAFALPAPGFGEEAVAAALYPQREPYAILIVAMSDEQGEPIGVPGAANL